ncbi:hypothetical protein [Planctomicrobium piriforme]|uniref:Uncharacterized protein n=1 Tax=Planctomicrobium piriforme TaxID=1576369 RepID=A0A1I3EHW2_9PLAN|nr:hypothetical protein [Planctomicrobium piriforme]SFH98552.1 hypothetical protein SAMN05421753_104230 [Planctomicrobium piriforme]
MTEDKTFNCRFCNGKRPHNGTHCLGCGAPLENAKNRNKTVDLKPYCPRCGRVSTKEIEPNTYSCNNCSAVFELDRETALDNRSDRSLEKRERQQKHQSQRRRFR